MPSLELLNEIKQSGMREYMKKKKLMAFNPIFLTQFASGEKHFVRKDERGKDPEENRRQNTTDKSKIALPSTFFVDFFL